MILKKKRIGYIYSVGVRIMMSINSLNLSPVSMLLFSIFIICSTNIVEKCL